MVARCLVLVALVLGGLHALVGCGDSGTVEGVAPPRLGKSCKTGADCGSSSQLACGVTAAGEHRCVASCASPSSGYVCIDGVPTSCEVAPAEHCKECGCPVGVGCMPKRAAGESCATDSDCNTNNCSSRTPTNAQPRCRGFGPPLEHHAFSVDRAPRFGSDSRFPRRRPLRGMPEPRDPTLNSDLPRS